MHSSISLAPAHPAGPKNSLGSPPPTSLTRVAEEVHWLRMPLPFALEDVDLWRLEHGAGWAMVDCGDSTNRLRALWEQVFGRGTDGSGSYRFARAPRPNRKDSQ